EDWETHKRTQIKKNEPYLYFNEHGIKMMIPEDMDYNRINPVVRSKIREEPKLLELENISNVYQQEGYDGRIGAHFAGGGSYDDFINKGYHENMPWEEYKQRFMERWNK
ncbi:MAG: hypothetical protein KGI08_11215, partial [Thaumarchaeota archaeon]|nr:hypothetical protein [Nitrososphaerota archaeon]